MDALANQLRSLKTSSVGLDVKENLITNDSHVYLNYDIDNPPPHPGKDFTRFVCVSDTHGTTLQLPPGDIFIHAGDLSVYGRKKSFETTIKWIRSLPHPIKLVIAGNHDRLLDPELRHEEPDAELLESIRTQLSGQEAFESGVRYLQYQSTSIPNCSWKVFGSPSWPDGAFLPEKQATPLYSSGAFQYYDEEAKDVNSLIPRDTQVLLTHGPPKDVLDRSKRGKGVGCPALADRLFASTNNELLSSDSDSAYYPTRAAKSAADSMQAMSESSNSWLPHVRLHVFGHIHEAWGARIIVRQPPPVLTTKSKRASATSATSIDNGLQTGPALMRAVETVFVNAAVQRVGTHPIIVDLRNPITAANSDDSVSVPASTDLLETSRHS